MQRQLLRDGRIVPDDWTYLTDTGEQPAGSRGLILTIDQWSVERQKWQTAPERLGLVILPATKVESLGMDLARFDLIAAEFPGPSDGRGYTQARLLRERYHFKGELRATGYVRRDQLFFLARCGFNSFELLDSELAAAVGALHTFSAEYQPSNDAGLLAKLHRR